MPETPTQSTVAADLLSWYDTNARDLPWRVPPERSKGEERPDPYRVWLSEVMLQQTGVKVVAPRWRRFVSLWPTVNDLAATEEANVMREWAGLGYYSRARNLHACSREVVSNHGGEFPADRAALRALPGIGDYTSAAIAAIAFGLPEPVVDGNVERVAARMLALDTPPKRAAALVRDAVSSWLDPERPGDFAQATMDLGATVCTPRKPACAICPVRPYCRVGSFDAAEDYPRKEAKKKRPTRRGAAFVARNSDGATLLCRRPGEGMLGGTVSVPMSDWSSRADGGTDAATAPFEADWRLAGKATHGFTHFEIVLEVWTARIDMPAPDGHWWSNDPVAEGLTTLLRRVLDAAEDDTGEA